MAYQHGLDSIARARQTVVEFTETGQPARDKALRSAADVLLDHRDVLVEINQADLANARGAGMDTGGLDRLRLTGHRVAELAQYLQVTSLAPEVVPVTGHDWREEYLTRDLAVRGVESFDDAMSHIGQFGTGHAETIITQDRSSAGALATQVNAATVAVNTLSEPDELFVTHKAHSRGPLQPDLFTTTKQIRWPE